MHSVKTLAVALLTVQSAWGALFPRSGPVKDLQAKDFKKELGDGVSSRGCESVLMLMIC